MHHYIRFYSINKAKIEDGHSTYKLIMTYNRDTFSLHF